MTGVLLALQFPHRFAEQLGVEVKADFLDVAALVCAENVARAANFEVAHGDAEARAQFRRFENCLQAHLGGLSDAASAGGKQVGVGSMLAAPDTAPELV